VPFYAVLGNNDVWPGPEAQIEYSAHSARWRMPGLYFKFTQAISPDCEVDFFGLDTRALHGGWDGWREQLEWLERELARSTARWKVVFGHNPIDSSGRHGGSRTLQRELLPILLAHGVDLYLCGHDHDMALMKPVDGLELVVSGSGGKSPRSAMWNDNVRFAYAGLGFTAVSLSETSMVIEFVDQDDETVYAYAVAHQEP
jgi:acid phosphatase